MQNKLQNLAGQHSDVLETLSPNVRKRVEFLREIQVWVLFKSYKNVSVFFFYPLRFDGQLYSICGCFVSYISFIIWLMHANFRLKNFSILIMQTSICTYIGVSKIEVLVIFHENWLLPHWGILPMYWLRLIYPDMKQKKRNNIYCAKEIECRCHGQWDREDSIVGILGTF